MKIKYTLYALAAAAAITGFIYVWPLSEADPAAPVAAEVKKLAVSSALPPTQRIAVSDTAAAQVAKPQTVYDIPILSEGTVLDAMRAHTASGFSFSGREFAGLGFFVEEIGGLRNADGFYWTLFLNGAPAEEGASSARVTPADHVEWRYQKGL